MTGQVLEDTQDMFRLQTIFTSHSVCSDTHFATVELKTKIKEQPTHLYYSKKLSNPQKQLKMHLNKQKIHQKI